MGMASRAGIHCRGKSPKCPCWAQGGLRNMSRGAAIACVEAAQWRTRQAGASTAANNYDRASAFASTKPNLVLAS
eukprot:614842-Pyramimonas_sp.AAC.1